MKMRVVSSVELLQIAIEACVQIEQYRSVESGNPQRVCMVSELNALLTEAIEIRDSFVNHQDSPFGFESKRSRLEGIHERANDLIELLRMKAGACAV